MKPWIPLTLLAFVLGSAAHAQSTCTYPRAPDAIPDGATATKEQMIAAKNDVNRYNTDMNAYLDCIKQALDAATPKDPSKLSSDEKKKAIEQEKMLTAKNNAAVDELQTVVGRLRGRWSGQPQYQGGREDGCGKQPERGQQASKHRLPPLLVLSVTTR